MVPFTAIGGSLPDRDCQHTGRYAVGNPAAVMLATPLADTLQKAVLRDVRLDLGQFEDLPAFGDVAGDSHMPPALALGRRRTIHEGVHLLGRQ